MDSNDPAQLDSMLNRFKRLMGELRSGTVRRNQFEPWEVAILLDLETCPLDGRRRSEVFQHYERAVERQIEHGSGPPMKLSEYLEMRHQKRVVNF
jgi:hypothetical protein